MLLSGAIVSDVQAPETLKSLKRIPLFEEKQLVY